MEAMREQIRARQAALLAGVGDAASWRGEQDLRAQVANMPRQTANDPDTVKQKGGSTVLQDGRSWSGPSLHTSGKVTTRRVAAGRVVYAISWEGTRTKQQRSFAKSITAKNGDGWMVTRGDRAYTRAGAETVARKSSTIYGQRVRLRSRARQSVRTGGRTETDRAVRYTLGDSLSTVTRHVDNNKLAAVIKAGDGRVPARDFSDLGQSWHERNSREAIDRYVRGPQLALNADRAAGAVAGGLRTAALDAASLVSALAGV
jgi:hypothetical protein